MKKQQPTKTLKVQYVSRRVETIVCKVRDLMAVRRELARLQEAGVVVSFEMEVESEAGL